MGEQRKIVRVGKLRFDIDEAETEPGYNRFGLLGLDLTHLDRLTRSSSRSVPPSPHCASDRGKRDIVWALPAV